MTVTPITRKADPTAAAAARRSRNRRRAVTTGAVTRHRHDGAAVTIAARAVDVDARTRVQAAVLADLNRRIAQIDSAVEEAVKRGRSNSAMSLAAEQRRNRADLVTARQREAATLAGLPIEAGAVQDEPDKTAADAGPVRYLAALIGSDVETVMRWFILLVAVLLDPAAVQLLAAMVARRDAAAVGGLAAQARGAR